MVNPRCHPDHVSAGERSSISELERAQADGALVRVRRRKHLEPREGYVLAVGERWLLLADLDPAILLDGFTALRVRDVKTVERPQNAAFVSAALALRSQWPPAAPPTPIALGDTRALLTSLRGRWPLVTVHPEIDDPDVCFVGEVQRVGRKTLRLREITPRATWEDPRGLRLSHITRVDVGGRYEQALMQVTSLESLSPEVSTPAQEPAARQRAAVDRLVRRSGQHPTADAVTLVAQSRSDDLDP